ncbi:MAG: hypothetical protein ACOCWU_03585 [Spirochaetota bacterium]
MNRTLVMTLAILVALSFASTYVAAQDAEEDLAVVYLGELAEETDLEQGEVLDEVVSNVDELEQDTVVYGVALETYFEGVVDEVHDLEENDVTEQVDDIAGDAEDIEEFLEQDGVNDETDTLAELME